MSRRKKDDPGPELVSREFCDERTKRVETLIEGMENRIINAINKKNGMSWQAKATIIASAIGALAAIIVAILR